MKGFVRAIQMEKDCFDMYGEQTGCLEKQNLGQGSTDQNTGVYAGGEIEYSRYDPG